MLEARSDFDGSFWFYIPNKGAPIAFTILFAASGFMHTYQCFRYKSWKVSGLLPWAASIFAVGFGIRAAAAFGRWNNLNLFIASSVFVLFGPPIYEVANFVTLGRILYYIPYHAPMHPGRVWTTFIAIGIMIELINSSGAALLANSSNPEAQDVGKALLKAVLIMQLALMIGFVAVAGRFHYSCARAGVLNQNVKRVLSVLYTSCALITIRTTYRTVEYFTVSSFNVNVMDNVSPIVKDEWLFWVFEATLMFCNTTVLNIFHPMRCLPRSNKIYLATDGVTEIEGPGYEDRRAFIMTVIDPFDLYGLITNRGKQDRYWEGNAA
ncbi:RTA1 domain protein [Aspergillus sp. HF37]|nr:RTA1 domain protein [Aspergillus sp. HF37]